MKEQLTNRGLARVAVIAAAAMMLVVSPAFAQKDKEDKTNQRSVDGLVTDKARESYRWRRCSVKDLKTLQIRSFITKPTANIIFIH